MFSREEIARYLPQYLSEKTSDSLFNELKDFPNNIDKIYSSKLLENAFIHQGDGISSMLIVKLPENVTQKQPSIVLSNTCDINPDNKRLSPSNIIYCPIFNLEKYSLAMMQKRSSTEISNHIDTLKKQQITQMFYLPKYNSMSESIVFLDHINSCDCSYIDLSKLNEQRLFSLSQYGHYMFLIKLSIHFTRLREGIDRG